MPVRPEMKAQRSARRVSTLAGYFHGLDQIKDVRRNAHVNVHRNTNENPNEKPNAGREIRKGSKTRTQRGTFTGTADASIRAWHSTSNPSRPSRPPPRHRHGSRCRSARRPNSSASAGPRRTSWHTAANSPPFGSAGASSSRSIAWPNSSVPTSLPSSLPSAAVLRHERAPRGAAGSVPDPSPKGNPKIGEHVCNLPAERLRPRSRTG